MLFKLSSYLVRSTCTFHSIVSRSTAPKQCKSFPIFVYFVASTY